MDESLLLLSYYTAIEKESSWCKQYTLAAHLHLPLL